jgi:colanic acid/amylovoran biosynthesis protein
MSKRRAIAITGATIWGNRGAEAMLVTTIGKIRDYQPGTRIIIFSYFPRKDRQLVNDPEIDVLGCRPQDLVLWHFPFALLCWLLGLLRLRVPDRLLTRPVRALRQCDALVDISGISFADGREKYLPFNVLVLWPALLLGIPVIKLSQAIGPCRHPLTRLSARLFLTRCHKIYARGKTTAAHLRDLGLSPDQWEQAADVAFSYHPRFSLSQENGERIEALVSELTAQHTDGQRIIGLAPSSLVYSKSGQDYVDVFLRLMRSLDADCHFLILPNATRQGSDKPNNNDLVVINAIKNRVQTELPSEFGTRVHVVDYDINTAGSRQLIALCDILVTSRFHAMVSSLSLGIPPLVIGWSHKYAEVLDDFDLARFAVDFADPTIDVNALVGEILESRDTICQKIQENQASVQESSARQFGILEQLLP